MDFMSETTSVPAISNARTDSLLYSLAKADNFTMLQHSSVNPIPHMGAKIPSARPRLMATTQLTISAEPTSPATTASRQPQPVPMADTTIPRHKCARQLCPMDVNVSKPIELLFIVIFSHCCI